MAYFEPFIDEAGIHIPLYNDLKEDLIAKMKSIYGNDLYLDEDSMDYQMLTILSKKIYDTFNIALLAYNNRTPVTAIGVGLDNTVAFANIMRKQASNSSVQLTLTGAAGAVIQKGEATDGTNIWLLPDEVVFPESGIIIVESLAKELGKITAAAGTINTIATPTFGWYTVTNNYQATAGDLYESDASLRGRYSLATRLPSETVFEALLAAVERVENVTRARGYENDTGQTSTGTVPPNIPAGLPPHSVTFVVEGGNDEDVATEIYFKKTPGCYTNGTTEVTLSSVQGNVVTIRFYRPTNTNAFVRVTIKRLVGYNEEYAEKIKQNIANYVQEMQLGENLYRSIIWSIAVSSMESINAPAFSVTNVETSTNGTTWSQADVISDFYDAVVTTASMVTVVET